MASLLPTSALPDPVQHVRVGETVPLFILRLDEFHGIVRCATDGFWTLEETELYLRHLARFIAACRGRFGRAKVIVDRTGTPVQREEVAARLGRANRDLYGPDDRLALVVDSHLVKGQLRRRFVHDGSKAFLSAQAAETWIRAA